ncbi:hypothetical protein NTH_00929 [Nitratireductor thuwali]|uniref:DUF4142 domain-containing protein n=2 Tax=Nitratireductor thuwali TaxID=2267699 RepID=A0ABY5MI87_9HYPH|nr:hypothetical protein NTH_00929 [Nitratireductor thuwali]
MNRLPIAVSSALLIALAGPVAAQVADIPQESPKAETVNTPLEFARMSVAWSVFQMDSSRLVAREADGEDIKRFANRTADTYEDLLAEVSRLAQLEGISQGEMPRIMETSHLRKVAELERAETGRLEELYIEMQLEQLPELIAMFNNYSQKGGELAVFAEETLPMLREQFARARDLADSAGIEAKAG